MAVTVAQAAQSDSSVFAPKVVVMVKRGIERVNKCESRRVDEEINMKQTPSPSKILGFCLLQFFSSYGWFGFFNINMVWEREVWHARPRLST